ncbi:MAG: hypothetical protein EB103_07110 [Actinobacteria bacterium]|nr:hypothetical protein [Actinomycetota bacterium]
MRNVNQTVLNDTELDILQDMRADYSDVVIFHFPQVGVCVGIKQTGVDTGKFALSLASVEESLYRYDVAEYLVLDRWASMQVLPCNIGGHWSENIVNRLGAKARDIAKAIA